MASLEDKTLPYKVKMNFFKRISNDKNPGDERFKSCLLIYHWLNVKNLLLCSKLKSIFVHVHISCDVSFLVIRAFKSFF